MTQKRQLKPRYAGHEALNSVVRADWMKAIALSPNSFEAYLYRPVSAETGALDSGYEEESVLELDTHQDTLAYSDPVEVKVLDCPDEQTEFFTMDDGGENLGESLEPLLLRVSDIVPNGSVLEWDEETIEGTRTVWWYVLKGMGYGTANVGVVHVCIPMRDFNSPPAIAPKLDCEIPSENYGNEHVLDDNYESSNLDEVIEL